MTAGVFRGLPAGAVCAGGGGAAAPLHPAALAHRADAVLHPDMDPQLSPPRCHKTLILVIASKETGN